MSMFASTITNPDPEARAWVDQVARAHAAIMAAMPEDQIPKECRECDVQTCEVICFLCGRPTTRFETGELPPAL